jgi:hypothetical protein
MLIAATRATSSVTVKTMTALLLSATAPESQIAPIARMRVRPVSGGDAAALGWPTPPW